MASWKGLIRVFASPSILHVSVWDSRDAMLRSCNLQPKRILGIKSKPILILGDPPLTALIFRECSCQRVQNETQQGKGSSQPKEQVAKGFSSLDETQQDGDHRLGPSRCQQGIRHRIELHAFQERLRMPHCLSGNKQRTHAPNGSRHLCSSLLLVCSSVITPSSTRKKNPLNIRKDWNCDLWALVQCDGPPKIASTSCFQVRNS